MFISHERRDETERRLRRIARAASLQVLDGDFCFEEFGAADLDGRRRADALALVRDADHYSQLVRAATGGSCERFAVWSIHFPAGLDNSGFVGWLASRIKHGTGAGVLVICGLNSERGGIHDYWGCPWEARHEVLRVVRAILETPAGAAPGAAALDGLLMRPVSTTAASVIGRDTLFHFHQAGSVVTAEYAGGAIQAGSLIGIRDGSGLRFRYVQLEDGDRLASGQSICRIERSGAGRLRVIERFERSDREAAGTNILEEVD